MQGALAIWSALAGMAVILIPAGIVIFRLTKQLQECEKEREDIVHVHVRG